MCPLEDLADGEVRAAGAGDREVAVFNVGGELFALDNACRHANGPLAQGTLHDGVVTCPWHWWRYHVATGQRLGSDEIYQPTYPVMVEAGNVVVEVPDPRPPMSMREQLLQHAREWNRDQ